MFTGLVQNVGLVTGADRRDQALELTLQTPLASQLKVGDSLCVDGVCLTVTPRSPTLVTAMAVAETLGRSTLGEFSGGRRVNLEPSLRAGDAMGGHLVLGHVDEVGLVSELKRVGESLEVRFEISNRVAAQIAEKGSVAVDGVSLTVVSVETDGFSVALVPHTLQATTLGELEPGQRVNIETDVLAKYVERSLAAYRLTLEQR